MPVIPLIKLYPELREHAPRWVRGDDGEMHPDFASYPDDAPQARVTHRCPVTGLLVLELPVANTDPAQRVLEGAAHVVDAEPDIDAGADEAPEAEADAGATSDAA